MSEWVGDYRGRVGSEPGGDRSARRTRGELRRTQGGGSARIRSATLSSPQPRGGGVARRGVGVARRGVGVARPGAGVARRRVGVARPGPEEARRAGAEEVTWRALT